MVARGPTIKGCFPSFPCSSLRVGPAWDVYVPPVSSCGAITIASAEHWSTWTVRTICAERRPERSERYRANLLVQNILIVLVFVSGGCAGNVWRAQRTPKKHHHRACSKDLSGWSVQTVHARWVMGAPTQHGVEFGATKTCSPYAQPSNRPPKFRVRAYNDRLFQSLLEHGKASTTSPRSFGRSVKSRYDVPDFLLLSPCAGGPPVPPISKPRNFRERQARVPKYLPSAPVIDAPTTR